jgi:hypothetical protein
MSRFVLRPPGLLRMESCLHCDGGTLLRIQARLAMERPFPRRGVGTVPIQDARAASPRGSSGGVRRDFSAAPLARPISPARIHLASAPLSARSGPPCPRPRLPYRLRAGRGCTGSPWFAFTFGRRRLQHRTTLPTPTRRSARRSCSSYCQCSGAPGSSRERYRLRRVSQRACELADLGLGGAPPSGSVSPGASPRRTVVFFSPLRRMRDREACSNPHHRRWSSSSRRASRSPIAAR